MAAASRFCRYELRTKDMVAARAFYTDVFGPDFWGPDLSISPLPERAAARGAPSHWLGHIGTPDVGGAAAQLLSQGAERLGAPGPAGAGEPRVLLRDPFGAILALSPDTAPPRRDPVAWHLLHVHDLEKAVASYTALFGWTAKEAVDLGPSMGRHQPFSWDDSGRSAGSVADISRLPHIHTQWLFFFPVPDIEASLAAVRARGGVALAPGRTMSGDFAAACDDPQGGAFGLYQRIRP